MREVRIERWCSAHVIVARCGGESGGDGGEKGRVQAVVERASSASEKERRRGK